MPKESLKRNTTNRKRTIARKTKQKIKRRRGSVTSVRKRDTTLKIASRKRNLKNCKRNQMGRLLLHLKMNVTMMKQMSW